MLKDSFGRVHDYLRISLTDICNFRCQYCIPEEDTHFMPSPQLMQADEIDAIAGAFVKMGVNKIISLIHATRPRDLKEIINRSITRSKLRNLYYVAERRVLRFLIDYGFIAYVQLPLWILLPFPSNWIEFPDNRFNRRSRPLWPTY